MKKAAKLEVSRFLAAWLSTRQLIQAANFNRFQAAGLSATQFMTLNLLPATPPGMTLTELARRMNLGPATLTRTVDTLEQRALLTRTRSEADRRQILLAVTPKGRALQNAASTEFHAHIAALFHELSGQQRSGLVDGLEALVRAGSAVTPSAVSVDAALPASHNSPRSRRPRS